MNDESGKKAYIAAMAPTNATVDNFWHMIIENNVSLVIDLCPEYEGSKVLFNYYSSF